MSLGRWLGGLFGRRDAAPPEPEEPWVVEPLAAAFPMRAELRSMAERVLASGSQGGAVAVRSTPGEGTSMSLLFPVSEGDVERAQTRRSETLPVAGEGIVLVVDDEAGIRRRVAAILEDAGYEVLEAEDGDAALSLIAARGVELRAIVLDVTMPGRDGHQTLAALREAHPALPVLLSRGRPVDDVTDPNVSFVAKPYDPALLVDALRRAVSGER